MLYLKTEVINMAKVMYCEKCGNAYYPFISRRCKYCGTKMKILPEELKYRYHIFVEDWTQLPVNGEEMLMREKNFVFGELKDNPIFSMGMYQAQVQQRKQRYTDRVEFEKKEQEEYLLKLLNKNFKKMGIDQDHQIYTPKCPICGSSNINKITLTNRAVKTAAFGVFGAMNDAGKTYKCGNCGSKF